MYTTTNNNANNNTQSKAGGAEEFNQLKIPVRKMKSGDLKCPPFSPNFINSSNEILARVLIDGYEYLKPFLEMVTLRAGQELFAQGEKNEYVYFPETCVVSHLYNLADGNTIEVAMVGREGVSGLCSLFDSDQNNHQARATIGGNVRRIAAKSLNRAFLSGGRLQKLLLDYFNRHLAQVSQRVVCQSFHPIEKRLCSWLLMINDRTRTDQLRITHEEIALILGVHRPTLSNIAKNLREAGLINYSRGKFIISNRSGLKAAACECYEAIEDFH